MNRIPAIFLLFCLLSFACKKESETVRLCNLQTPVITGFQFVDATGNYIGKIGEPNTNTSVYLNNSGTSSIAMFIYPNPSHGMIAIQIKADDISDAKIWISRAIYNGAPSDIANLAGCNTMVAGGYPVFQMLKVNSKSVMVDLFNTGDGYYRVYIQIHDILLWDNLIVSKNYAPNTY